MLGSVLPDIDLKDSRPSKAMFSGLAVFFSFVVLFTAAGKLSIAEMFVVWLGTLAFVRYGAKAIFHQFSYHRGVWHSILAAVFCSAITAVVYYYLLRRHEGVAWLAAAFMFLGFLTHLILDEMYSVDVMDVRVKQSFGTAVKLLDAKHWGHSGAMVAALALVLLAVPPTKTFTESVSSKQLWTGLQSRLLPVERDKWFGVDWAGLAQRARAWRSADVPLSGPTTEAVSMPAVVAPEGTNPIATGTIEKTP